MTLKLAMRGLPEKIIRRLNRHPFMVGAAATLGIRVGADANQLRKGEIDRPEFRARQGANVAATGLGLAGARLGMVAGSFMPLGTILGALAGGMVGEAVGSRLGRRAVEQAESRLGKRASKKAPPDEATAADTSEPKGPEEKQNTAPKRTI